METIKIINTIPQTMIDISSSDVSAFVATIKVKVDCCKKCKKTIPITDDHQCCRCGYRLCRACDDVSDLLRWVDMGDQPDEYICYVCDGEKKKKKKEKELPSLLNG